MRIQDEIQVQLQNSNFRILASNRGAILREIHLSDTRITRDIPGPETEPGAKGGLFCAPQIFARIENRSAPFRGKSYSYPYPEDMDADLVDPDKIYIHGLHYHYTWEILEQGDSSVSFVLPKSRLPKGYPFPHTSIVTYDVSGNDLLISVSVSETDTDTPAMLTVHPFFKFNIDGITPSLTADLAQKFDYNPSSTLPMATESPIEDFPEKSFLHGLSLPKDLDHSFISNSARSTLTWGDKVTLSMIDETPDATCPYKPLQVWTTGAEERNAFGIEQGGPANLLYLVENNKVDENLLPIVSPGEIMSRVVRYKLG